MDAKDIKNSRLDVFLFENGFASSRELAKKLILESSVVVNGDIVNKPSRLVSTDDSISVLDNKLTKYVSRGGLKLEAAIERFNISVTDLVCIDIGASTGGFTDVLLQNGAEKVYAVENGIGQLHPKISSDSRVVSLENTNARTLAPETLPVFDLAVMDVSFVSQTLFFDVLSRLLKNKGYFVSLIKPQFEAGRQHLNKKGIVKDEKVRQRVVENVLSSAAIYGFECVGTCKSPIEGGDGNVEYLAVFILDKKEDTV